MADDKKFNIELGTTADTSGLEAVERQLKAVGDAAQAAVNPMTDGSQLRAGRAAEDPTEKVRETTKAIEEQADALEDLTDEQAGVIDATKRLNQEAAKPDGFQRLFTQQRLIQTAQQVGGLARAVGQLGAEFAKTEAGKEMLSGLSEEAKVFGSVFGKAVAEGGKALLEGGPIAAGVAVTTSLIKDLTSSLMALREAEEQGAAAVAAAQDEYAKKARERLAIATDRAIADTIEEETRRLDDQNEKLAENARLMDARRDAAAASFELQQEQQRAEGKPEEQLRAEKIRFQAQQEREKIRQAELQARYRASIAEQKAVAEANERDAIGKAKGTNSPEFQAAAKDARSAAAAQADAEREAAVAAKEAELQRSALEARTAARLQAEARQAQEAAARDTQRRQEETRRAADDAARTRSDEARRRTQLGREGEGIADGLIDGAGNPRQQAALEQIGNRIAADPGGAGLGQLADAIERMITTADDARARDLRRAMERIARLEAKLKSGGDAK